MKKMLLIISLLILFPAVLKADTVDGRTDRGVFAREGIVLGRGILNLPGTVLEVIATPVREHTIHAKAWPLTGLIRIPTNVFARAASAVNDIVVYPFMVPFTNDISPLTEPMGIPEYAWSRD